MNIETAGTIATAALVIISKIISTLEHKKTEKTVDGNNTKLNAIYIMINSRMDELLEAAKEAGRQEIREEQSKK